MRVPLFLRDQHVAFETLIHAPAYTASRRAKYLHLPGRNVAKCVLLSCPTGYVVAVIPAICRIDLKAAGRVLGNPVLVASPQNLAAFFRDCEWGSLAPFGRLYGLTTILDDSVDPDSTIVFPTQRHFLALSLSCRDFERLEEPRRFAFARPAAERPDVPRYL
jgi:Ala-tRNA(Pro) deacylase